MLSIEVHVPLIERKTIQMAHEKSVSIFDKHKWYSKPFYIEPYPIFIQYWSVTFLSSSRLILLSQSNISSIFSFHANDLIHNLNWLPLFAVTIPFALCGKFTGNWYFATIVGKTDIDLGCVKRARERLLSSLCIFVFFFTSKVVLASFLRSHCYISMIPVSQGVNLTVETFSAYFERSIQASVIIWWRLNINIDNFFTVYFQQKHTYTWCVSQKWTEVGKVVNDIDGFMNKVRRVEALSYSANLLALAVKMGGMEGAKSVALFSPIWLRICSQIYRYT